MRTGKKGFTLIEMVIVVVIIGILMLVGLGLNRDQLKTLKSKTLIENLQGDWDQAFMHLLNSSSIDNQKFAFMQIKLNKTENTMELSYFKAWDGDSENEEEKNEKSDANSRDPSGLEQFWTLSLASQTQWTFSQLKVANQEMEDLMLLYQPFSPRCQVQNSTQNEASQTVSFILENAGKQHCFQLQSDYCRLKAVSCASEEDKNDDK